MSSARTGWLRILIGELSLERSSGKFGFVLVMIG